MRTLGKSRRILVAAPALGRAIGEVDSLSGQPLLGSSDMMGDIDWRLVGPGGAVHDVRGAPRMSCGDFRAVREAAVAGLGVALMPDHSCRAALHEGTLAHVLPDWGGELGIVHLVFTTRRGLPPAVRALIDHLAAHFPKEPI
jgi:DNA-binding transcriptional LysR family regulator